MNKQMIRDFQWLLEPSVSGIHGPALDPNTTKAHSGFTVCKHLSICGSHTDVPRCSHTVARVAGQEQNPGHSTDCHTIRWSIFVAQRGMG